MNPTLRKWLVGIGEAFLSGGTTAMSTNWVDPTDFNIYTRKFWLVVLASAMMSAVRYTQKRLADINKANETSETVTVTTTTVKPPTPEPPTNT